MAANWRGKRSWGLKLALLALAIWAVVRRRRRGAETDEGDGQRAAGTEQPLATIASERGGDLETAPAPLPETLPDCCVKVLGRPGWFDPILLTSVKVKPANALVRAIQRMAGVPIAATTLGDTIYFADPQYFDPHSPAGLGLLAHELRHVEQYREQGGMLRFALHYIREFLQGGYGTGISFEAEASEIGSMVQAHLQQEFAHNAGVSPCQQVSGSYVFNAQYRLLQPYPALPIRV